jgi:hypothetical protein
MTITFGKTEFEGPLSRLDELNDEPGVYALLCFDGETFKVLDVQIATHVQTSVAKALAAKTWHDICQGKMRVAAFYTKDEHQQMRLRQEVLWSETL